MLRLVLNNMQPSSLHSWPQ